MFNNPNSQKKVFLLGGAVLLVVLVVFGLYLIQKYKKPDLSGVKYVQSYTAFSQKGVSAVSDIQSAVEEAQKDGTADAVALQKALLANAYFARNQGADRQQAADILKAIIADQSLSAATRGLAYSYMASWLYAYQDEEAMKQYVFNTAPYSDYLAQAQGDVTEATISLFDLANNIQSNAFNNYESAGLLVLKLRAAGADPTDKDQQLLAKRIKAYVDAGDAQASDVQKSMFYTQNPGAVLFLHTLKSIALATIQPYFPEAITNAVVIASFDQATSSITAAKVSVLGPYTGSLACLQYIAWLGSSKGISSVEEKIATVASLLATIESKDFAAYVQKLRTRPSTSYLKTRTIRAANLSKTFKNYLLANGWQTSDFSSK